MALGASDTTEFDKMMGALGMLSGSKAGAQKAFDAASAMYAPVEEANPWEASLRYFLEMGKQASQPGSTLFGSAVGAGLVPLDYLTAKKKEKRDRDQKVASTAFSLAPSLKPKVTKATYGKPEFYMVSKADGKGGMSKAVPTPLTAKDFADMRSQIEDGSVVLSPMPTKGEGAQSALGKLLADYDGGKGSMTAEQFTAAYEKITSVPEGAGDKPLSALGKLLADYGDGSGAMSTEQFTAAYEKITEISDPAETSLEKLRARAIEGGLEVGSDEYKEFVLNNGRTPTGFSVETRPDGSIKFVQGNVEGRKTGRVTPGYVQLDLGDGNIVQQVIPGSEAATEVELKRTGYEANMQSADFLLQNVEKIIGRPAGNGFAAIPPNEFLSGVLGPIEGLRDTFLESQEKTDLVVKIKFLESNAFTQAFETLKGAGAITENEGRAATAALAMLDRAQSPTAFAEGLTQFASIIKIGRERQRRLTAVLPQVAGTISGGANVDLDFSTMDTSEIKLIDVESLTNDQKLELGKRLGIVK